MDPKWYLPGSCKKYIFIKNNSFPPPFKKKKGYHVSESHPDSHPINLDSHFNLVCSHFRSGWAVHIGGGGLRPLRRGWGRDCGLPQRSHLHSGGLHLMKESPVASWASCTAALEGGNQLSLELRIFSGGHLQRMMVARTQLPQGSIRLVLGLRADAGPWKGQERKVVHKT